MNNKNKLIITILAISFPLFSIAQNDLNQTDLAEDLGLVIVKSLEGYNKDIKLNSLKGYKENQKLIQINKKIEESLRNAKEKNYYFINNENEEVEVSEKSFEDYNKDIKLSSLKSRKIKQNSNKESVEKENNKILENSNSSVVNINIINKEDSNDNVNKQKIVIKNKKEEEINIEIKK